MAAQFRRSVTSPCSARVEAFALAQALPRNLHIFIARSFVYDRQDRGNFHRRKPPGEKLLELLEIKLLSLSQTNDHLCSLIPVIIGHADDRRLPNSGMAQHRALHVGRVDIVAASDDHVLQFVVNGDKPVFAHRTEIAAAEETVDECLLARFRIAPVFLHYLRAAQADFANFASLRPLTGFVGLADFHFGEGQGNIGALRMRALGR